MKNKNAKKLFLSLALTAVAGAMATTSTYAWFSTNRVVNANGIRLQAKSTQSLVISSTYSGTYDTSASLAGQNKDLSPAGSEKTVLCPATHPVGSHVTFQAPKADAVINTETGKVTSGDLETVTNVGTTYYYVDYSMYIAVVGSDALASTGLVVKFDSATLTTLYDASSGLVGKLHTAKAYTFDFFASLVDSTNQAAEVTTEGNYKGSIAVADLFNGTGAEVNVNLGAYTVPLQGNGAVKVTIRAYLDGNLELKTTDYQLVTTGGAYKYNGNGVFEADAAGTYASASGKNYVNSKTANTGVWAFGFEFTA